MKKKSLGIEFTFEGGSLQRKDVWLKLRSRYGGNCWRVGVIDYQIIFLYCLFTVF